MKKHFIEIIPADTLFFRDGKPFEMGDETAVDSKPIPYPSVFWGAIFSYFFKKGLVDPEKDIDKLKVCKVYLYNNKTKEKFLPAPADLFYDDDGNVYTEKYESIEETYYGIKQLVYPDTEKDASRSNEYFINIVSFEDYLKKNNVEIKVKNINEEVFELEPKIGIARDNFTKGSKDNNLYRVPMVRFKKEWSFLVEIDTDFEIQGNEIIKLGGENKTAFLKKTQQNHKDKNNFTIEKDDYFKLISISPVIFKEQKLNKNSFGSVDWNKTFKNFDKADFLTVTNFDAISVGGWDYKNHRPKPMVKALPAGSVFVFQAKHNFYSLEFISEFEEMFLKKEYTKFGFNQFLIFKI